MIAFKIEVEDFIPELINRIEKLHRLPLEVGYFQENGIHEESGLSYANLMRIHHLGAPSVKIPPRPVFDVGLAFHPLDKSKAFNKRMKQYLRNLDKPEPIKAETVLKDIGKEYVETFRSIFGDTGKIKSNSPFTQTLKAELGFKPNNPLIMTGSLKDAMSFKVSDRVYTP